MHTFDRHPYARRTLRIAISRSSLRFVWVCGSAESISCIALCSCGFNNAFPLLCVSRARYERIQWKWKLVAGNFSSSHPTHDTRHELILCACVLVCENGWILIWVSENDNKTCVYVLLARKTWSVNRMNVVIFRSRIFFFSLFFFGRMCAVYATDWLNALQCCNAASENEFSFLFIVINGPSPFDTRHLMTQIFITFLFDAIKDGNRIDTMRCRPWRVGGSNISTEKFHSIRKLEARSISIRECRTQCVAYFCFYRQNSWLTSAAINANVLSPPKKPTPTQMMNMNPDSVRMVDSKATRRKCDHPGVVGENDS